ncbi:unnamed protein product [Timema podura]|uniref:Lon N-terminal domain-containing protein n=2 Tax=Timema TaxID=61471 RepID=A0ABN7NFR7_TIMPD|nr:unnamed protein product [Timema podura]
MDDVGAYNSDMSDAETPPYPVYASTSDDDSDNVETQGSAVYSVEHERQFEHTFDPALPVKHSSSLLGGHQSSLLGGHQSSLLGGHHNHGPIGLDEEQSIEKNGHFLTLLRFRAKEGDKDLESHLQSSNHNTSYIRPYTQNKIIDLLYPYEDEFEPIPDPLLHRYILEALGIESRTSGFIAGNIDHCTIEYLGNDLEELQGRTMLDDDSIQTLALLPQPGVVLVPGQTLPLSVFYPPTVSMLRQSIATDRTFGVVCVRSFTNMLVWCISSMNMKILILTKVGRSNEFQEEERSAGFRVKAKGRQRFKILETHRQVDGNVSARVRILPEVVLPHSLNEIRLASLDRHQSFPGQKRSCFMKRNAMLTQWPSWVHAQFEASRLVELVKNQLEHLKPGSHTGEAIRSKLDDLLQSWGLNQRTVSIYVVSDNAINIVDALSCTTFQHVPCFTHNLQLAIADAKKGLGITDLLATARNIVTYYSCEREITEQATTA